MEEKRERLCFEMMTYWAEGLNQDNLKDIKVLEHACGQAENLNMKLNWDMLNIRPADERNDLLCYEGNELAAYLGLYAISRTSSEIEVTGMVHPRLRRTGIGTKLLNLALDECSARGAGRILIVTDRSAVSGVEFARKSGARHEHSEYRMKCDLDNLPAFTGKGLLLREPSSKDYPEMKKLDSLCFGDEVVSDETQDKAVYGSSLVAELNGVFIGKVGIIRENGEGYIFGLAIKPEHRGKGYGREMLSNALCRLKSENLAAANLEVAVENDNALMLYKTSGFREITVFDYYELLL